MGGGGTQLAASVQFDDETALSITWPTVLPEPKIEGGTAVYRVSATTDLLVGVTGNGVTSRLRLNAPPDQSDPVFTFGVDADGLELSQSRDGSLRAKDADGDVVGRTSPLVAWDAQEDDAGDPQNVVRLDADLTTRSEGSQDLILTSPDGFLSDPRTKYPVIIDPDIASLSPLRDTWVRSGDSTNRSSGHYLAIGKINGSSNTEPAQAFLKFHSGPIETQDVISAELGLYQYYGYTCSDRRMNVLPVGEYWNSGITEANKPDVLGNVGDSAYVGENRGASGCGAGWTTVDVTNMANSWGDLSYVNEGLRLTADDGERSSYERRFCSMDPDTAYPTCGIPSHRPYLKVTYVGDGVSPSPPPEETTEWPEFDDSTIPEGAEPSYEPTARAGGCYGMFRRVRRESGELYWGGYQRCSDPNYQTLNFTLDRWNTGKKKWVQIRSHGRGAVIETLLTYTESVCSSTTKRDYRQRAYGWSEKYGYSNPYPASIVSKGINCFVPK